MAETSYGQDLWQNFPGIREELQKVSALIKETTASQNPIISSSLSRLFEGNGKMLRPGLLLLCARFGKTQKKHYHLAACLEMLHVATLIHDDVIDDSPFRRGIPTVHSQFGKRDAVLVGDYLLSRCFLLAAEYTSPDNAVGLAKVISIICLMEIEQNNDRFGTKISLRHYFRKILGKSAMLFSLACYVGAYEAKVSKIIAEKLRRIGYNIGMAFQIIDDILDYTGTESLTRKPLNTDLKDGLVTLPLICAFNHDSSGILQKIFSQKEFFSPEDVPTILELIEHSNAIALAQQYAMQYSTRALKEIQSLPAGVSRDYLEALTQYLLIRDF
ncbi:putative Heptaprenyl diphosphate synthase component 2 [Pillotina sp. SPG140]